jgi:hypothetical protein
VIVLGYLLGLVRGPLLAVVGGLALVTLGRCAAAKGSDDVFLGGALAVLAGALQVGGLRWETLDLAQLRGAQAVLGPTVLVGPEAAAAASTVAGIAGVAALAVWLASARRTEEGVGGRTVQLLWFAEAALGAFAIVTVFWGASVPRGSFAGGDGVRALAGWVLAVAVVGACAVIGATYLARVPSWRRWIAGGAGVSVLASAVVVAMAVV